MMEIFRILDEMEMFLKQSKKVPLTGGQRLVDIDRFLDRVDRIRAVLPEELEASRILLAEKQDILEGAQAEASQYVEQSTSMVERLIDDNEIARRAQARAEQLISEAQELARRNRREADEYADGVLTHVQLVLQKGLDAVISGKDELRRSSEEDY